MFDCGEFFKHTEFTFLSTSRNNSAYGGAAYSHLQLVLLNLHTKKLSNSLRKYQHEVRKDLVYMKIISNILS